MKEIKLPFEKMYSDLVKTHIGLIHFLYDNYKEVLREYEKNILKTKLRIEFA